MIRSVLARAVAPVVVATLALGGQATAADWPSTAGPTRILLVGDSLTQGSAGDITWRYRLDRQLRAGGAWWDFVGSRSTLTGGEVSYADPAFDPDHFARWGASFRYSIGDPTGDPDRLEDLIVPELVTSRPEVVVCLLGLNDLFYVAGPREALAQARVWLDLVRAVDPGIDVVFSTIPSSRDEPREYNELLRSAVPTWSAGSSQVTLADPGAGWDDVRLTYDGVHPNAIGEQRIAARVADALAGLGVGAGAVLPERTLPLGPRSPATLEVSERVGEVQLAWQLPPGATHVFVWERDVTAKAPWRRLPFGLAGPTWTRAGLVNGHEYRFKLTAAKGDAVAWDISSAVVSAVPGEPAPRTPTHVRAAGVSRGAEVGWWRSPRAVSYDVARWPLGAAGQRATIRVSTNAAVLRRLTPGRAYVVMVRARGVHRVSPWSPRIRVRPTAGSAS